MIDKKEFFRLLGAKNNIDSYLFWMFHYWYQKEHDTKGPFYKIVEVIEYPNEESITLRFDNDEDAEYTIPLSFMHDKDDTPPITMLWYSNYYDGPLDGLAEFEGERVWFHCVEMEDNPFQMRRFSLYKMSADDLAYEDKWHKLFNELVGYHCDYGIDDNDNPKTTEEQHDEYFRLSDEDDRKIKKKEYTENECLGTFDESFIGRKTVPTKDSG